MKKLSGFSFFTLNIFSSPQVAKKYTVCFWLFLAAVLTSGCASLKKTDSDDDRPELVGSSVVEDEVGQEPVRSFDPDTLYDLMVAELGGQRKRYDLALGNYLKQAHKTQDKGVAKRAYQISQLIGAKQASLDAALLWAKLDPDNPVALQASAVEMVKSGDLEGAVQRMTEVLAMQGEASFDFLAANATELTLQEREQLLDSFDAILSEYPDYPSLKLGKGILLLQSERFEEAMELCDQLLSKDSGYVKAIVLKGRVLNRVGRGEDAEKMLSDAVKDHPERLRLRLLYARVLVHLNKLKEAREQFQTLLQQSPHNVEIILSLALIALENEMYDESSEYFSALIKLGHRKSTANYYLGRIAEQRKDFEKAKGHYLEVSPGKEFMTSRVALIQILLREGKVAAARNQLEEDRHRYPVHGVQLYLLESEVLVGIEEYDDALKVFDDAIVRYPKSGNLLYARAMVFEKLGHLGDLEKDLREIIKMQPDNAAALNALGYTLADRTTRFDEAKKLIEQAYKINSEDPAIIDSMGWIEFRLGNYQSAHDYLKRAYEKYPDPEVAAHLGEVLWNMGRQQEALALFNDALKKKPDSKILLETRERLKKIKPQNKRKVEALAQ